MKYTLDINGDHDDYVVMSSLGIRLTDTQALQVLGEALKYYQQRGLEERPSGSPSRAYSGDRDTPN